jgi:hypothetical protein
MGVEVNDKGEYFEVRDVYAKPEPKGMWQSMQSSCTVFKPPRHVRIEVGDDITFMVKHLLEPGQVALCSKMDPLLFPPQGKLIVHFHVYEWIPE